MTEQPLVILLNKLGIIPQGRNGDWLQVSCPLSHLHQGGHDENPSCGISISEEKESIVHCFACGTRTLSAMLATMVYTHDIHPNTIRYYIDHEILQEKAEAIDFQDKFRPQKREREPIPVPDHILEVFQPNTKAKAFLESRKINPDLAKNIVCYKNGIVFLIKDEDKKTYWLHYRAIQNKEFRYLKPKEFNINYEWGRSDSWYGMDEIDWNEPIMLVEGEFDVERLKTMGVNNVLASHGSIGKYSAKVKRLNRANLVILGFDADQTGKRYKQNAKQALKCKTIDLDWSVVGANDAGDLRSRKDFDKVWQARTGNRTYTFRDKYTQGSIYAIL